MDSAYEVVVIGAGAAGLLAAIRAAERGRRTLLLEKNRKPGVKILMSGGTRCNLTHATDARGIVEAFGEQGPFLHSALASLSPDDLVAMFEAEGVRTKIEETGKVFPVSDRALDVLQALLRVLKRSGAELQLETPVTGIDRDGDGFVVKMPRRGVRAEKVIVTVGGQSYPGSGTTGDGYAWAKRFGHKIVPPRPALTPLTTNEQWVTELRGVTVPDVRVEVVSGDEVTEVSSFRGPPRNPASRLAAGSLGRPRGDRVRRGSFLFTHFGLSGPAPMDISRVITERPQAGGWRAVCDFVPNIRGEQITEQLQTAAKQDGRRGVLNMASELVPRRLAEAIMTQAGIPLERRAAELSRAERNALVDGLKRTAIPITGTLGFKKAEVTAGGVSLDEVDSRTMESKLVPGLYFAGEVLDLDGPIGGYNFQSAFSTGFLAGEKV
jgi:predicted flavoprotein YhiN